MKKILIIVIAFFTCIFDSSGQFIHYYNYAPVDVAFGITETIDSSYIVAIGGGTNPDVGVIVKIDSTGSVIWDDIDQSPVASATCVIQNQNSDYTLLEAQQVVQSPNIVLRRYTSTGSLLWSKDSLVSFRSSSGSLVENSDSSMMIVGEKIGPKGTTILIKCNQNGDTLFTKEYSDSLNMQGYSIIKGIDSGYIIASVKYSGSNGNLKSTVVFKIDSVGNELWRKEFNQTRITFVNTMKRINNSSYGICLSSFDSITNQYTPTFTKFDLVGDTIQTYYFSNATSGQATSFVYDSTIGYVISVNSYTGDSIQLIYLDTNGIQYCSKYIFDLNYRLTAYSMIMNHNGKLVLCGSAYNSIQFAYNSFVTVLDTSCNITSGIYSNDLVNYGISIFPNPFTNEINIESRSLQEYFNLLIIRDIFGRIIYQKSIEFNNNNSILKIEQDKLVSGLYFVELKNSHQSIFKKVIKQ